MSYAAAALTLACFVVAFRFSGILAVTAKVIETSRHAAKVICDPVMDDIEKERIVKRSSLELLRSFFSITGRTVAAVLVSVAPLVALEMADLAKFSSVTRLLSTWQGIVLSSFVMAVTLFVRTKN